MAKLLIRNHKKYPLFNKKLSFDQYTLLVQQFWKNVSDELLASNGEDPSRVIDHLKR